MAHRTPIEDGAPSQESLMAIAPQEDLALPAALQSLLDRSITAWFSLTYVGVNPGVSKDEAFNKHIDNLREIRSLDSLLQDRQYWFFQLRDSFLNHDRVLKWDSNHLERYILLPVDYGFANNQDCYFVSHYWHTKDHPDPEGSDLRLIQEDLRGEEWSYVWLDWTCMPQVPRTDGEQRYFNRMLRYISMLVRDCAFAWRFPSFEPRAWVLFEVAEFVLTHKGRWVTDDIAPFIAHVDEMVRIGNVHPIIDKYGYRCTKNGDMRLVVGWLEILVIIANIVEDVGVRQCILDVLNRPIVGSYNLIVPGMPNFQIDKANGTITLDGETWNFTPVFDLTSGA